MMVMEGRMHVHGSRSEGQQREPHGRTQGQWVHQQGLDKEQKLVNRIAILRAGMNRIAILHAAVLSLQSRMMETLSDRETGRVGCVGCVGWAFRESQGDPVQKTESLNQDIDFLGDFGCMDTAQCGSHQSGPALDRGLPQSVTVHETKRDMASVTVHRKRTLANAAMGLQQ
jgi:hypothetical protein